MVLIFDVDRSLASIGGAKAAERLFGIPPIAISRGIDEILDVLKRLFKKQQIVHKHPLGTEHIEEALVLREEAEKYGLEALVIDTLSVATEQQRVQIMAKRGLQTMDLQAWGLLTDMVMRFGGLLSLLPITVICTAHIDHQKDELGGLIDVPAIKGSGKYDINRFFDVILYTVVNKTKNGHEWLWQTKPDHRRTLAKDRLGVLPEKIPQNFQLVLAPYKEHGIAPKILVLGDSGQGKTYSLRTLSNNLTSNSYGTQDSTGSTAR